MMQRLVNLEPRGQKEAVSYGSDAQWYCSYRLVVMFIIASNVMDRFGEEMGG
jgi:hypothetical protein